MRYVKFLVVPLIFVTLAFMNIGGCGSSGGGSDSGCCIVDEDVCFDNTNQTECDFLGGDLEKGRSCNSFPICGARFLTGISILHKIMAPKDFVKAY